MKQAFIYNGKLYCPKNLDKKLRQLGITLEDIELTEDPYSKKKEVIEEVINPVYHHIYKNFETGYTIYSTLEDIQEHEGYELIK